MKKEIEIFCVKDWPSGSASRLDYELLDTGEGEKLERFGQYTFVRPYENAIWPKTLVKEWNEIDGKFWSSKTGAKAGWKMSKGTFDKWKMEYRGIKFLASPTPFRHLGFFPEQANHWDFIEEKIQGLALKYKARPCKFLNLFGYTGVASLFALRAGAEVTHLDASRQALAWAKENQQLSGLGDMPMRVIEDDALKFLGKEIKRGNKYDAIVMDPPKFGRGPKGEIWKIEEMLSRLLSAAQKVLSDKPLFVILTSYAVDSSALSLGYALEEMMEDCGQKAGLPAETLVKAGELCVLEKSNNRLISLANTAVWSIME